MSSIKEKMTALADAIRDKTYTFDLMTIDDMTEAVKSLSAGGGGGGTVVPSTRSLTVTPAKEKQTFSSSDLGINTYYSVVTVNAIPAEYITTTDATALVGDILEGKTAYVKGSKVTGRIKNYGDVTETFSNASNLLSIKANGFFNTITVNLTRKTLEVTPTKSTQTLRASSEGSDVFYTQVNVAPIPAEYITTADATATEGTILEGKTAYVNGEKVTGKYIAPSPEEVSWGVRFGYDGFFQAGTFTGDATAEAEDIAPGKTAYVLGRKVTGAMPAKQSETYTPGTADITIKSGVYLAEAQTIKGDANLTADNIKTGVSIFDVEGTFTSDADATASDIASGKTAYVKGEKVTGTASLLSGFTAWRKDGGALYSKTPIMEKCATPQRPIPGLMGVGYYIANDEIFWVRDNSEAMKLPNDPHGWEYVTTDGDSAYAISHGKLYRVWRDTADDLGARCLTPDIDNVSEVVISSDRCIFRAGNAAYVCNNNDTGVYSQIPDISISKLVNQPGIGGGPENIAITTDGDIAKLYYTGDGDIDGKRVPVGSSSIAQEDRANGDSFINVYYVSGEDIWMEYGGVAYMLAFRSSGLWYKNFLTSDAPWIKAVDPPALKQLSWLGNCVTEWMEGYRWNEELQEEEPYSGPSESTVALHIDTSGRLWKISAALTAAGEPAGIKFTQVGEDNDWQYVPPYINKGETANHAQKGGKFILLSASNDDDIKLSWKEWHLSPSGTLVASAHGRMFFSLEDKDYDVTRAGGLL